MKEIAISVFKAKCLSLVDHVQKTKTPIRITKFGKPLADVVPSELESPAHWMGSMKHEIEILEDIVSPANDPGAWEALRD